MKTLCYLLFVFLMSQNLVFAQQANVSPQYSAPQYQRAADRLSETSTSTNNKKGNHPTHSKCYSQKKAEYFKFLDNYIRTKKQELDAEGVSISVISKKDVLFRKGYGYSDKERQTAVTPSTLFGVGSVSKVITGIAIMQLVEQGLIDLDAPLENYIPGFSYKTHFPDTEPITVRMIMSHQSGLVGDINKGWASINGPAQHYRELIDILADEYVAYPPRYISSYSNCAVALLGIVIEEVSGIEFKKYVKEKICMPLGMVASNFSLRDNMAPLLAKSYDIEGNEMPVGFMRDEPAGSFISNTFEMSLFMRMILNGGELFGRRILQQSTLEQMLVQQNADIELDFPNDHGMKYGLSWFLSNPTLSYAGKYFGHSGWISQYYTEMHFLPEHGLAVIVETNSQGGDQLSTDVANMAMIKALEIFKGIQQPAAQPVSPIVQLTQDHVQQMSGIYATNQWGVMSIYQQNDRLFASSPLLGEFELLPHGDDWYSFYLNDQPYPDFEGLRITVRQGREERFMGIEVRDQVGDISSSAFGAEYTIPEEVDSAWINRMGQYEVVNPDPVMDIFSEFTLDRDESGIIYMTSDLNSNVIDPIFEDEAIIIGRGSGTNETIQVVDYQGEEHLKYSGFLYKKRPMQLAPDKNQDSRVDASGIQEMESESATDIQLEGGEIAK
jgi:CubicO group peptidase (beta-lactamase class C family)